MAGIQQCTHFLQRLIQTPGLPGEEGATARLVGKEMEQLGFHRVRTDEAGSVIGFIRGRGAAPPLMFNTHLDHVDAGDPAAWPHPPFGGVLQGDRVWGRGAVDIKGPLAAQVYGIAGLLSKGRTPPGDVYVTAVVQEEVGGLGARHLAQSLPPMAVIVGEPSRNQLRIGHRGRTEAVVHVSGRSVHASIPEKGVNPLQVIGRFLNRMDELELGHDPLLGPGSVAPTLIRTDQRSANVIPAEVWLTCDWRYVPSQSAEEIRGQLQDLLSRCLIGGSTGKVDIPTVRLRSYTGFESETPASHPAFVTAFDHPAVEAARRILSGVLAEAPAVSVWRFATDGGHFAQAGWTVVGFGPGDETLAHTAQESIAVSELEVAMAAYQALADQWTAAFDPPAQPLTQ